MDFLMRKFAVLMFVLLVMGAGVPLIAQQLKIDMAGGFSIRTLLFSFACAVAVYAMMFFLFAAKIIS
jgi:hypothetical protein